MESEPACWLRLFHFVRCPPSPIPAPLPHPLRAAQDRFVLSGTTLYPSKLLDSTVHDASPPHTDARPRSPLVVSDPAPSALIASLYKRPAGEDTPPGSRTLSPGEVTPELRTRSPLLRRLSGGAGGVRPSPGARAKPMGVGDGQRRRDGEVEQEASRRDPAPEAAVGAERKEPSLQDVPRQPTEREIVQEAAALEIQHQWRRSQDKRKMRTERSERGSALMVQWQVLRLCCRSVCPKG